MSHLPLRKYKRCHTEIKLGVQFRIITDYKAFNISKTCFYRYRNDDFSDVAGLNVSEINSDGIRIALLACQRVYKRFIFKENLKNNIIRALLFLLKKPPSELSRLIKKAVRKSDAIRQMFVEGIHQASETISLKKACFLSFITRNQFYSWLKSIKSYCPKYPGKFCPRTHPNQLAPEEIRKIKEIKSDPFYKGWFDNSIFHHAFRNNKIITSLSTFYSYINKMGLKHKKPDSRRKNHEIGIRAEKPNDLIHTDLTYKRNKDQSVSVIYLTEDNFSRFILSYHVDTVTSAEINLQNLKNGLKKCVEIHPDRFINTVSIMSDGGPENKNGLIKQFMDDNGVNFYIAGVDIFCSNSMIEACNKNLKYTSLYVHETANHEACVKLVAAFVQEYNYVRPQGVLNGLTPNEVYTCKIPDTDQWRYQRIRAMIKRIIGNQQLTCDTCCLYPFVPDYSI